MIDAHTRLEAYLRDLYARRPFEDYQDQPDTAERARLAVYTIPFALPEKKLRAGLDTGLGFALLTLNVRCLSARLLAHFGIRVPDGSDRPRVSFHAAAAPNDTESDGGNPCP